MAAPAICFLQAAWIECTTQRRLRSTSTMTMTTATTAQVFCFYLRARFHSDFVESVDARAACSATTPRYTRTACRWTFWPSIFLIFYCENFGRKDPVIMRVTSTWTLRSRSLVRGAEECDSDGGGAACGLNRRRAARHVVAQFASLVKLKQASRAHCSFAAA